MSHMLLKRPVLSKFKGFISNLKPAQDINRSNGCLLDDHQDAEMTYYADILQEDSVVVEEKTHGFNESGR